MADVAARLRLLSAAVHPRGHPPDGPAEMAARTGLPAQLVTAWFDQATSQMNPGDARAVAQAYGVPVAFLLDDPVPADVVEQLELLIAIRDAGASASATARAVGIAACPARSGRRCGGP
jgi:hypothetical protein